MTTAPLRAVVAMDSFKGSVTSLAAGVAVARGIREARADAVVEVVAVADGGEGTVDAVSSVPDARPCEVRLADLLGRPVVVPYVILGDAVVVESATVVGLSQLECDDEGAIVADSPRRATSAPLGVLIRHVIDAHQPAQVLVGLGGTGTTDGGTGMISALGGTLRDADGAVIDVNAGNPLLQGAVQVELPEVGGVQLRGLTDVRSPLCGPTGAARMFGPQKGADAATVEALESAMGAWERALPDHAGAVPGAGAAGGLGAAIVALGGDLVGGAQWLLGTVGGDSWTNADLVVTGEGRIDAQSAWGKVPHGVATLARRHGSPVVVALGGSVATSGVPGVDAVLPIHTGPVSLREAMTPEVTERALAHAARQATLLMLASHGR